MASPRSSFVPFKLQLANNATLAGISCIPSRNSCTPSAVPLIVGIHGGSCTATNYDVSPTNSASIYANALGVPFVAIDRPNYGGTSPILPCENFTLTTGEWLHEYILPALWEEFGKKNNCTALVLNAHSMGVPPVCIASYLHWQQEKNRGAGSLKYPLAGIILSGWGIQPHPAQLGSLDSSFDEKEPGLITVPLESKTFLMLSDPGLKLADEEAYSKIEEQNGPMPLAEAVANRGWFQQDENRTKYYSGVNVPVLCAFGELDWVWKGTKEHVKELETMFDNCPRFEAVVVGSAPHAIEWSKAGKGWYTRCFGWAAEVAVDYAVRHADQTA